MIMDRLNEFCDAVSLSTAATGRALLGNQTPLSVARDIGAGEPVYFVLTVDSAVTSTGSATVSFELASDASASIATDASATEHVTTPAFPVATLVAGFTYAQALPIEGDAYEAFLGVIQNVGTAALNGGKINAFLSKDARRWKAYADAVSFTAST